MNSIALYIHIPFCEKKCFYCDFNSYSGKKYLIEDYIKALKKEITLYKSSLAEYTVGTIFFGGGTPSILSGKQMSEIMNILNKSFIVEDNAEISMESNPGTLDYNNLKQYYDNGINRLSIGLQACQNHLLKTLGRIHDFEEYTKNIKDARKVGFTNINTDLMFSLPSQSKKDWKESLRKMVDLNIPHISAYSLIVEEDTPFHNWVEDKKVILPNEDTEINMYHYAIRYLKEKGYKHYEISNFSKPGFECKHNLIYWENKPYIGFGAGAHSYFNKKRFNNVEEVEKYISLLKNDKLPVENKIDILVKDEISEFMFLGLRLINGISIDEFKERFNISPFEIYKEQFNKLKEQGLVVWDKHYIKLTSKGIDFSNIVFQEMLL